MISLDTYAVWFSSLESITSSRYSVSFYIAAHLYKRIIILLLYRATRRQSLQL